MSVTIVPREIALQFQPGERVQLMVLIERAELLYYNENPGTYPRGRASPEKKGRPGRARNPDADRKRRESMKRYWEGTKSSKVGSIA